MNTQPADKLLRDLRVLVDDTEALLKATAGHASEHIVSARSKAAQSLELIQTALATKHGANNYDKPLPVPDSVRNNAWKIAGIAAGIGLVFGWVFGRPSRR